MDTNPKHLILNLLLAAGDEPLSARDAIEACALFGVRENSVRVALARLGAAGMIEAEDRGSYRLGPQAAGFAADIARWRTAEQRVRAWNGHWIAVHLGALGRSDRAALRNRERALALTGLRELEPALFVRPDNLSGGVAAVRERLQALSLEAAAPVFVASGFDEAREQRARGLWDGAALSRGYREHRRKLEDWLARAGALDVEAGARESYVLGNDAIRALVFDPLLPEPLVDVAARRAFVETVLKFDRAGRERWRHLAVAGLGGGRRAAAERERPGGRRAGVRRAAPAH